MGRKKIEIHKIDDVKNREVTFNKRKVGLMKKAIELSVLCDCQVAVIVFHGSHLYQYSSEPAITSILEKYNNYQGAYDQILNEDLDELKPGKASSFKVGKTFIKERYEPQPAMATVVMSNDHVETSESSPSSSALGSPPASQHARHQQQTHQVSSHPPAPPSTSLLSKRKKRTLNVHIPVGRDQSVIELASSYRHTTCNGTSTTPSQQALFSPRYVRGPGGPVPGMLAPGPNTWPTAVPCISPPYLHYGSHPGAGPPGAAGLSSSLNTPTLSPFAPYPAPYGHGPSSPALPLATYPVGQL